MRAIVNIDVPDLASAIEFYCAALGLRLSRVIDDSVAELLGGTAVIYLLLNAAGSEPAGSGAGLRRYSRHWTPVHVDFVVADLRAAADRATKAGARRESESVWRGSNGITFSDPFGHGFCLVQFDSDTYQ